MTLPDQPRATTAQASTGFGEGHVVDTTDVRGDRTVLTVRDYDFHMDPTERDPKDAAGRKAAARFIGPVLRRPSKIYRESDKTEYLRYTGLVAVPELGERLKALVVTVDPTRDPHEVVTWIAKRNLEAEDTSGGLLYDAYEST